MIMSVIEKHLPFLWLILAIACAYVATTYTLLNKEFIAVPLAMVVTHPEIVDLLAGIYSFRASVLSFLAGIFVMVAVMTKNNKKKNGQ